MIINLTWAELLEAARPVVHAHYLQMMVDKYPVDAPPTRIAQDIRHRFRTHMKLPVKPEQVKATVSAALRYHAYNQRTHRQVMGVRP